MRHYEIGEWADFARNVLPEDECRRMAAHLETGCEECTAAAALVRRVSAAGATESGYESASSALAAAARRIFTSPQRGTVADKFIEKLAILAARLTYDSLTDLQPAGARGLAASRQMLYEAGDFCLDLRFDRAPNSLHVVLVGQVANQQNPDYTVSGLLVLILSGEKAIVQTTSNEFGEFSLEYLPKSNLRLCVPIPDANVRLEIPLKQLLVDP